MMYESLEFKDYGLAHEAVRQLIARTAVFNGQPLRANSGLA